MYSNVYFASGGINGALHKTWYMHGGSTDTRVQQVMDEFLLLASQILKEAPDADV